MASKNFETFSNNINNNFNNIFDFFYKNKIIFTIISILLILYSALIAPKLPKSLALLVDNIYIKLIWIFLIAYISSHNPLLSLLISLGVLLTMQTLVSLETTTTAINSIKNVDSMQTNNVINPNAPINYLSHSDIPLSPPRVQIIQDALIKIDNHKNQLQIAKGANNVESYNNHLNEINNNNILIDNIIKTKHALILSQQSEIAKDNGNYEHAEHLMNQVNQIYTTMNTNNTNNVNNNTNNVNNTTNNTHCPTGNDSINNYSSLDNNLTLNIKPILVKTDTNNDVKPVNNDVKHVNNDVNHVNENVTGYVDLDYALY